MLCLIDSSTSVYFHNSQNPSQIEDETRDKKYACGKLFQIPDRVDKLVAFSLIFSIPEGSSGDQGKPTHTDRGSGRREYY